MTLLHWPAALDSGQLFITDGGLETTLIFEHGVDLPHFAAFHELRTDDGTQRLRRYYEGYVRVAREHGVGVVLGAPTWRAHSDWGTLLGYSPQELAAANRRGVELVRAVLEQEAHPAVPGLVSGDIGPRGDGYVIDGAMSAAEAAAYHGPQVATLASAGADLITAYTMTYAEEATGLVLAAEAAGIPIIVSFTTETDGRLPSGQELRAAIEQVDAATGAAPVCFMVNCSHPSHFSRAFDDGGAWLERIGGLRANPSTKSHAELDESTEADPGDPAAFALGNARLQATLKNLKIVGGCCGTDERHAAELCNALSR